MTGTEKLLLLIGGAGVLWWLTKHKDAQASLSVNIGGSAPPQNAILPSMAADPGTYIPITATVLPPPASVTSAAQGGMPVQALSGVTAALTSWANATKNPALALQFIGVIDAQDTAGMYDLIVNDWEATGKATPAQVAFWNDIRARYPFLSVGGVGCNNFNCN